MKSEFLVKQGFTLIELAVVLVIIGLIVGGILVGQDLIAAAQVRAQITQIEKYNQAVNTFKGKYGELPGDMDQATATQLGFAARGTHNGQGDGDGIIKGFDGTPYGKSGCGYCATAGETVVFWVDLSTAGLIDGNFIAGSETTLPATLPITGTNIGLYLPAAKIGSNNYINVWSGGIVLSPICCYADANNDGNNYFSVVGVLSYGQDAGETLGGVPGLTVMQAYKIDAKIDDGFPQSGNVTAMYLWGSNYISGWAAPTNNQNPPYTTATAGSTATCFDNSATSNGTPGVGGTIQHYSIEINNGSRMNCALSFRFQ